MRVVGGREGGGGGEGRVRLGQRDDGGGGRGQSRHADISSSEILMLIFFGARSPLENQYRH